MPEIKQYRHHWSNCCHYKSGRIVLWIVKWMIYLYLPLMILNGIHGYVTGKYPLNKQSYNLQDIRER